MVRTNITQGSLASHEEIRQHRKLRPSCETDCFNPLTSFVLHVMYHNFASGGRRCPSGPQAATDVRPSTGRMDDIVKAIEEWEGDAKAANGN